MTHIEQAIRDAVEKGGYKQHTGYANDEIRRIEVEYGRVLIHVCPGPEHNDDACGPRQMNYLSNILLDPLFWQALGKARGWSSDKNLIVTLESYDTGPTHLLHSSMEAGYWRFYWLRFIEHLADGKDAESFFASLQI